MVEEVIKKVVFGCNINSEIRAETRLGHLGYLGQLGYILSGLSRSDPVCKISGSDPDFCIESICSNNGI